MTNSNDNKSNVAAGSMIESQVPNNETVGTQSDKGPTPPRDGTTGTSVAKLGNKNALVHGIYSKYVVYPWESEVDFNKLLEDFTKEWKPDGCSEELAVYELTHNSWLKRRLLASVYLQLCGSTVSEALKMGEVSLEDIVRHQTDVPKQASGALFAVKNLVKELDDVFETIRSRKWPETEDGRQVRDALNLQHRDVSSLKEKINETVVGGVEQLVEVVQRSATRFEQAYQFDEIEKQLDLMAKLDVRTEKILRRLTSLKEYKRLAKSYSDPPTVVESPSLIPGETSTTDTSSEDSSEVTPEHRGSGKKD
jgi:hypothetical protein